MLNLFLAFPVAARARQFPPPPPPPPQPSCHPHHSTGVVFGTKDCAFLTEVLGGEVGMGTCAAQHQLEARYYISFVVKLLISLT